MFNKAVIWDKTKNNPMSRIKLFKENNQRTRFLEKEEISKLLLCCNKQLRSIAILALNTGMRKSEILNLKWHDCDIKRGIIYLRHTKSGKRREIPMNREVKDLLFRIPKNPENAYLFGNKEGKAYVNIRKAFENALKKAGIQDFRFHDLRHTFASQLVMSGVDLNTVRELLGHSSLKMTLRYAHLSSNHKKQAVETLDQFIGCNAKEDETVKEIVQTIEAALLT